MFALIVAVVSLWSTDPGPLVSPAPAIAQRLPGGNAATGFSSGAPAGSEGSVISICTFGSRAFDSDYWASANAFSRTLALPACSDDRSSGATGSYVATGFVPSGFARLGFAPLAAVPLGLASPWLPQSASYAPAASHAAALPAHLYVSPGAVYRGAYMTPFAERMRPMPVAAPASIPVRRRH